MEVPDNFGTRLTAIAETTPRSALANLLEALCPRRPVATRAPTGWSPVSGAHNDAADGTWGGSFKKLKRRATRTRAAGNVNYTVNVPTAWLNHRSGTRTRAMVESILACTNTADARAWLLANYPEYENKTFDMMWLSKIGYITII